MTASKSIDSCKTLVRRRCSMPRPWAAAKNMAEIARDAILYGGKDVAKAQKAAEDLLQKLVANGCGEANARSRARRPRH